MATSRKSFYDAKNYNPIQRAASTVGKYVGNVKKEVKQFAKGAAKLETARYKAKTYPPADRPRLNARANALRAKQDKNLGQLVGAIVQGRRYDKKGRVK